MYPIGEEEATEVRSHVPGIFPIPSNRQKQVRQTLIRYLKTPEGQHYIVCMKTAALSMRSDFEMASLGL